MKRKDLRNIVIFTNFDSKMTRIVENKLKELGATKNNICPHVVSIHSIKGIYTDQFRNFYYFTKAEEPFDLKSPRTMGGYKQLELEDLFSLKRENTIPPLTDENAPLKERLLNKGINVYLNYDLITYVVGKLKYIFEKNDFVCKSFFPFKYIYIDLNERVIPKNNIPLSCEIITVDQFKDFIENIPESTISNDDLYGSHKINKEQNNQEQDKQFWNKFWKKSNEIDATLEKMTNNGNKDSNPYKTCVSDCNCNYPYVKIWSGGDFSINNQIFNQLIHRNYNYTNHLFKKSLDENLISDEDLRDVRWFYIDNTKRKFTFDIKHNSEYKEITEIQNLNLDKYLYK